MGQLSLNNVEKYFGQAKVINDVSLTVKQGEFVVFVGPSGCGKSTLLRMIAGLEEISEGEITIDGTFVNNLPPVQRGISMVFQSYALYPHLNVFENLAFPLRVAKKSSVEIENQVSRVADILQLNSRLKYRPGELSGGQRQRVAIGRAIVRKPKIFLFDEPLSNLDAALRTEMRIELIKLHQVLEATMIYVTHDQVEAMTMADRIVVLNDGSVAQIGSPLELYHRPTSRFVASFIGNPKMNFIDVKCVGFDETGIEVELAEGADCIKIPVEDTHGVEPGQNLALGFRPEHTSLDDAGEFDIPVVSSVVERLGSNTIVYSRHLQSDQSLCSIQGSDAEIEVGQKSVMNAAVEDCHLFDNQGRAFMRLHKTSP